MEAASKVFHEKGYEGSSVQEIADAVGMLKGSLYYWIDSKEDLLYWTIKDMHENFVRVAHDARRGQIPAAEKLRRLIVAHTIQITREVTKSAVFFQDFGRLGDSRRKEILDLRDWYTDVVVELVAEGQKDKALRSDIGARAIAVWILGALNWTYTWYLPLGSQTPRQIGETYAALILDGLRA